MSDDAGTELDQAVEDIDKAIHVVQLQVILLKICRRHASEVVAAGQLRSKRKMRQEMARAAEAAVSAFTSQGLSSTTKGLVIDDLRAATDFAVTARAWALGIDLAMQKLPDVYTTFCGERVDPVLKEGDPYPTRSVDLRPMYGGGTSFSRQPRRNAATAFDRVNGLALWPSASSQPLRVIYDTRAGAYLDRALSQRKSVSILAVVPNRDFWSEFKIDEKAGGLFFGVHPKNAADQETAIKDALQAAADHQVDILVTPELSSTKKTVDVINTWLTATKDPWPAVVIAGGSHIFTTTTATTSERRNRMSTIYADRNLPEVTHDKIGEFVFTMDGHEWEEDIDRSTELRLHAGTSWSMITLICADLLEDAVVDAVADLCPRLVIVPSMSSKTGDYEMSMGAVIRRSQALVMVVNGPPEWRPSPEDWSHKVTAPVVVIGMPLASSWIERMSPDPSEAAPYMVLFRSDRRPAAFIK